MARHPHCIEALLRGIHAVEYALPGEPFSLKVRYVGDDHEYACHPPPRDNPFTPNGLRDPALGNSGPIAFSEIASLTVEPAPRLQRASAEYLVKYQELSRRMAGVSGLHVGADRITAPDVVSD